jgi:sulfur carrier protein
MEITLNGQAHELTGPTTLTSLLESLGLAGKPVVAELNREPVLPRLFPDTRINAEDSLEIITLAAGG